MLTILIQNSCNCEVKREGVNKQIHEELGRNCMRNLEKNDMKS